MRILFVSPYLPSRIRVRPYYWVRSLVELGHAVHLVALQPPEDAGAPDTEMRRICTGVDVFPLPRTATMRNAALALPRTSVPLQFAYSHHAGAEAHVAALARDGRFDVVHVEHMRGAALVARTRAAAVVYDAVDSISMLFEQAARHAPSFAQRCLARFDLPRTRRFEARVSERFDRVVVSSQDDAAAFRRLATGSAPPRMVVIPNGVDTDYFRPAPRTGGAAVVFTGKLSYHANVAAALRLATRIMPLVWRSHPDTPLIVAGQGPPPSLTELVSDRRISVTGTVDDIRTVFASAAVAACPLVYGVGIQNKVLEALASGVPAVVSTSAARSLGGAPGTDYLACDTDEAFAEAITRVLREPALGHRLGAAGRRYVCQDHDWSRLASRLVATYEAAIGERQTRGREVTVR